jgi:ATP-dependent helicase HepA
MLFGSEAGNASFAVLADRGEPTLLLETCFVVECVAPPRLAVDRFLGPTPVRLAIDQKLARRSETFAPGELARASPEMLLGRPEITTALLPRMLDAAVAAAAPERGRLVAEAIRQVEEVLGRELERLELLRATGGRVEDGELALARDEIVELRGALAGARLRLDSLRLVWNGPRELLDARGDRPRTRALTCEERGE